MLTGSGGCRAREGNSVLSFSMNGSILDVWNTGKILLVVGRFRVTVENSGLILIISYGLSYRGMNLMTCFSSLDLYSQQWWSVLSCTCCPTSKGKIPNWCLLAWSA